MEKFMSLSHTKCATYAHNNNYKGNWACKYIFYIKINLNFHHKSGIKFFEIS